MTRPELAAAKLARLGRVPCGEAWPEIIREATGMNRRTFQRWHRLAEKSADSEIGQTADLRDEMDDGLASLGLALIKLGEAIRSGEK
jgi:hypothetical protein